jgi:predicted regulator of Ras-like GTPase activity (Roadblock/LC7/MglB family)
VPETRFREAARSLRSSITGIKAIVLIGPDGVVLEYLAVDPRFDLGTFSAEYATLLRIARRASEDTDSGELSEHISISERTIVLTRSFLTGFCLVVVSDARVLVGRARYELKKAAWVIERAMRK